jgi:hypothetical protein
MQLAQVAEEVPSAPLWRGRGEWDEVRVDFSEQLPFERPLHQRGFTPSASEHDPRLLARQELHLSCTGDPSGIVQHERIVGHRSS